MSSYRLTLPPVPAMCYDTPTVRDKAPSRAASRSASNRGHHDHDWRRRQNNAPAHVNRAGALRRVS